MAKKEEKKSELITVEGQTPHGETFAAVVEKGTGETVYYAVGGSEAREAVRLGDSGVIVGSSVDSERAQERFVHEVEQWTGSGISPSSQPRATKSFSLSPDATKKYDQIFGHIDFQGNRVKGSSKT